MALRMLNGPALEPLELADAKAHLRVDAGDEDGLISSLITTARLQVEAALDLALITQQWRWSADCWPPGSVVELALRPVQSVEEIRVFDAAGSGTIVDAATYVVDTASNLTRIAAKSGSWPLPGARLGGIEIDFTVGYGAAASDVPADIIQALHLLIAFGYEHRDPAHAGDFVRRFPEAVSDLLRPYRAVRL